MRLVALAALMALSFSVLAQSSSSPSSIPWDSPPGIDLEYKNLHPVEYPIDARRQRWTGVSVVVVSVDANAFVIGVRILQTSGYQSLDKAAMKAAKGWKYTPGYRQGMPRPCEIVVPVVFNLTTSNT
jgi:periplasmic protein TonB